MTEPAEIADIGTHALRPGMVVGGKFALLRRVGEGGVGVVFEAEDTWIGRRVALKVLHSHLAARADVNARFRREARAAAMTHHPNIVAVYEVGLWHGTPYIVQELLDGETLRDRMVREHRLSPPAMIEIMVPIMGALAAAHRAGIVHRDIKPENIFLSVSPVEGAPMVPKLIDFGVAKIASSESTTLVGSVVGTPMYMSPEQAEGLSPADHRSDIWAVGAVMYEMLSDHLPYEGPSAAAILGKIVTEPYKPLGSRAPDLPAELVAVVHRALERDPAARYATVQDFLYALLDYAEKPDPTIAERHARSLPPPAPSFSRATPAVPLPAPPPASPAAAPAGGPGGALDRGADEGAVRPAAPEWARPMAQPELGWDQVQPLVRAPRNLEWYTAAAGQALRDNALDEAVDHAEHAVVTCRASGEVLGQMRLVQAIALRWLGHYADSERAAHETSEILPQGSPGWYAAVGHLAILGSYLGHNERFPVLFDQLTALERKSPVPGPHIIAASRLAVSLVRAGQVDRAAQVLASARAAAEPGVEDEPAVRAWIFVAAAEFAMYEGDPAGSLRHLEAAVTCFGEAGDARNACLQRSNIGNGYMQLGAYARAKGLLKEAIAVGEPMRLGFITPVRSNLGFVLARLGDLDQALEIETAALEHCIRGGYRRFEMVSRLYLAIILWLRAESAHGPSPALELDPARPSLLVRAEEELRAAVAGSDSAPPIRAYALATLADLLFSQDRRAEACAAAEEGMSILCQLEGIEEGESLIRLEHVLGLEASRDTGRATLAIAEARRRLLARADRINDARLRRSFLDHIPENARTLALAARYKVSSTMGSGPAGQAPQR